MIANTCNPIRMAPDTGPEMAWPSREDSQELMMTFIPASQPGRSESREAHNDADVCRSLQVMEKLSHIKDVHALLDAVLREARQLTRADAGSIYLIENNVLNFSYIHNDSLFGASPVNRYLYTRHTLAIDNHSLAGYVALTGKPLIIDDVYHIPAGCLSPSMTLLIKSQATGPNRSWRRRS